MAFKFKRKNGKEVTLLNPAEKARKFARELKDNLRETNDGRVKTDKHGNAFLSKEARAYRAGYLDSRRDGAKAWKHNKKKRERGERQNMYEGLFGDPNAKVHSRKRSKF